MSAMSWVVVRPVTHRAVRYISLAGLTLGSAAAVGMLAVWLQPTDDVILLLALGAVLLAPLVWRTLQHRFDPFEPIVVFAVTYAVMFVLRPAAMVVGGDYLVTRSFSAIDVSGSFTKMLVVALTGAAAFVVGYALPAGRVLARGIAPPPRAVDGDTVVALALGTAALGAALFAFFLLHVGGVSLLVGFWTQGFRDLPPGVVDAGGSYFYSGALLLVPAALVLLGMGRERRSSLLTLLGLALAALAVARALPEGTRLALLPLLGGGIVSRYLARQARPHLLGIVLTLTVALIGSAWVLYLRDMNRQEGNPIDGLMALVADPGRVLDPLTAGGDNEMASVLAAALQVIPAQLPYTYGASLFRDLALRAVPRSVWPGKPLTPRQRVIRTVWPEEFEAGIANPEFSVLLHFYLDLGLLGVGLGMGAYGILARAIYAYLLQYRDNMVAQVLFATLLPFIVIALRDSPIDVLIRAIFMVLPVVAIFLVARQRDARSSRLTSKFLVLGRAGGSSRRDHWM